MSQPIRPVHSGKNVNPLPRPASRKGLVWIMVCAVAGACAAALLLPRSTPAPEREMLATATPPPATPAPLAKATPAPPPPPALPAPLDNSAEVARVQARIEAVRAIESARPLFARRDFAGAAKILDAWLGAHPQHPQRAPVERQVARLRAAEQAVPAMLARPAALVGAQIPVGNAVWPVSGAAHGKLVCRVPAQFGVIERTVEISALGEAALVQLLQRADAATQGTLAPAFLLGMGKSAEARAALRGIDPKVDALRADADDCEQSARDGALLAELDGVESLLAGQQPESAGQRLAECEKTSAGHEFLTVAYGTKIGSWRSRIASAPPPAARPAPAPAAPAGPAADGYPGVPVFTLSTAVPAGDPERKQLLQAAQWAAATGQWERHFTQLRTALVAAAGSGSWQQRPQNFERLIGSGTPALAAEQARFLRAVQPAALAKFSTLEKSRDFLNWLLARPAVLAAFNDAMEPQDRAGEALAVWRTIWYDDEENRETLASLAIACALVFDQPVRISPEVYGFPKTPGGTGEAKTGSISAATPPSTGEAKPTEVAALARYRFFRDAAKKGALKVPLQEMTPWELVWVVDAPVPESELAWAQKQVNFSRRDWGKAYGHIRYRMDRATQKVNPYEAYTLAQIEKEGGICGDQAYFAAISAKANGIPAMVIAGEGDRGGHAWVGYELARNEWKLDTGRYADNFAAGTTRHPQTGQAIKEHELRQLTDPARRAPAYEKSMRLLALALLLADAGQGDLTTMAINAALAAAPKNYDAWMAKLDQLAAAKAPAADWLRESTRMRTTFREFSDLVQEIDKREAEYVAMNGGTDAARKLVHLQTRRMERKDGARSDLILDSVFREVELADKAGDKEKAGRIFRDALREKGGEVVPFKKIAAGYYGWAKKNGKGPETVRELISVFDRNHDAPATDVFALQAYRQVLTELSGMAREQGLETQQRQLDRREAKLKETEEKQGKLQSRGADR